MNAGTKVTHALYEEEILGRVIQNGVAYDSRFVRVRWEDGREYHHPVRFVALFRKV
jgi:hypothetical protein